MTRPSNLLHLLLPAPLRGILASVLLALNTVIGVALMMPPALLKLVLPVLPVRRLCDRTLNAIAAGWVAFNNAWIAALNPQQWDVQGMEGLHERGWYLVSPNHQTWVDILVLQRVFHGRIPFLKFFLKRELMWVPVIGLAWWALDFPFMKRGRNASSQADDLETTRKACERFKTIPTTVINFVEGTRFSAAKHAEQNSPYQHLLKPKVGALSMAMATMGDQFEAMLDVTLAYPDGTPSFWDLLCGRCGRVRVYVQQRPIPAELVGGNPMADKRLRAGISMWIKRQWSDKDALLQGLRVPE
ncbi:acyltransferase [Paucibacter sp. DJ1R-11]|uniref:acyltransferase n=1 Tax=Paucibacter sp. DJ1R-11 TaxID=2893556 RepID=UPI0021E462BE|nr:acyltransferase [Paucibacter sp. DJ1R-11]MCV2366189.1 acyltransferase [Paucibacter sp. DJ1R-11]